MMKLRREDLAEETHKLTRLAKEGERSVNAMLAWMPMTLKAP